MRISYKGVRGGILCAAILLLCAASVAFGDIKNEITKSFTVAPGGELNLETDIGSVEVRAREGTTVDITVILEADTRDADRAEEMFADFEVEFDQDGNDVIIEAFYNQNRSGFFSLFGTRRRSLGVIFEISVPTEYNVRVETRGGSIAVEDLRGTADVNTSGGSLYFENIEGPLRGKTSGGRIEVLGCKGDTDIKTSGGGIEIEGVTGGVVAHTSGGSISVEDVTGQFDASTSGGSISAKIREQPTGDCRLVTSGGSINIYLAESIAVNLDAKTSGGRVSSDFGRQSKYGKRRKSSVRTEINGGGPELYLRTSAGSINIREW